MFVMTNEWRDRVEKGQVKGREAQKSFRNEEWAKMGGEERLCCFESPH